uniref:Uncharacterized protein n=1 Tax=Arundo donax TaxID=35708 RepID=A0A0A9ESR6_ARUDO
MPHRTQVWTTRRHDPDVTSHSCKGRGSCQRIFRQGPDGCCQDQPQKSCSHPKSSELLIGS